MAEQNSSSSPHRRRASFTGQPLADLFTRSSNNYQGPITTAAAQAQRRRLSVTTLSLSNSFSSSPTQPGPLGATRQRSESISSGSLSSSGTSGSVDESPFEEGDAIPSIPTSPLARRLSFGARALRDVRAGGGNGNANGEGFNFAENMRSKAERSSTISAGSITSPTSVQHIRSKSMAAVEPPIMEIPKTPKVPDPFQERILKGDFYLD